MAKAKKKESLTPEERLQAALVPDWEQPYKVPENWCWVTLGSINQYQSSSIDPSKHADSYFELYSVPSSADHYPEIAMGCEIGSTKQGVEKGDVLLCKINPRINRVWKVSQYTENALLASSEWIIIRNPYIHSDYLMYCLRTPYFREYMLSNVSGVGGSLMRAQPKYVQTYPIPISPLSEQQRIVDRIESLFEKLDEAKQKAQDVLDSFETRKAAILHKAFTGELTAGWRKEHNVGRESWGHDLLKNIVTDIKDKFDPTAQTTSLRYIGLEHIQKNQGIIGFGTANDIRSLKTVFKTGDILYGKLRPYLNKHDIAQFDGICSTDILVYRTQYPQTAKYINYFMDTEWFISTAVSNSKGINLPRVSGKEIGNTLINVPLIEEQTEIVRILDELLAKEQQAKEAAEAVLEQIDRIKKSILARAFRGELGTNDPAEESAVGVIKRVPESK